jgi:hypothetical protein
MPEKKDRDMWWAFLQGRPESEWVPKSKGNPKNTNIKLRLEECVHGLMSLHRPEYNESSQYNDEGEVEQVLRVDPADSLPSPAGTPVPLPLEYLEEMMQPSASGSLALVFAMLLQIRSIDLESRRRRFSSSLMR